MATVVPFNRRTRSSVDTSFTPPRSPRARTTDSPDRQRNAKRRVVYPADDVSSPAKRTRRASSADSCTENASPIKVPSKSFYGGGRGRYLSPLERKDLEEIRQKNLSPPFAREVAQKAEKQVKSPPAVFKPSRKSPRAAAPSLKTKGQHKATPKRTSHVKNGKAPLQEILPGSPRSPLKNKTIKEETRVYSPSRSGRKFFKSRRVSDSSGQPNNVVQRNTLRVKYQPKGVVSKPKEVTEKPKLLVNTTTGPAKPKNSPVVNRAILDSPSVKTRSSPRKPAARERPCSNSPVVNRAILDNLAVKTRSSPRKTTVKDSQSSGRSTIPSSKNPNSQDLFSPSDWDFDDEEESGSVFNTLNSEQGFIKVGELADSGQASGESSNAALSNCSLAGDSVAVLSELSEKSVSPASATDQSTGTSEIPDTPDKGKVYSIFKLKGQRSADQNSSAQSTPMSTRRGLNVRPSPKLRSLTDKHGKEQLTLDFGQKLKGAVQCEVCGMTYNHGEPSDEAMHKKFHDRLLGILRFPGWKKEHVLQEFGDGSRIIRVMPDEKIAMKKVIAVKKIVDEDLGFVVDGQGIKPSSMIFMYISEEKRIAGVCIAEPISSAYRVVAEDKPTDGPAPASEPTSRPWCCSTEPEKARCGINRIWVVGSERRRGTASKLLDCVMGNFLMGYPMHKTDLAFTDPTPDGRAFATKYTGTPCFLVYKHHSG